MAAMADKEIRARVFFIAQYENNPRTGVSLKFNEENIKTALSHKTLQSWAYILHDKDAYTAEDENKNVKFLHDEYAKLSDKKISVDDYVTKNQWVHAGATIPRHWHVVCQSPSAITLSSVAKWFGIQPQYVELPKGRGAFLDCVAYLTHGDAKQQAVGKIVYADDAVKSNFAWREAVDERATQRAKYGGDLSPRDATRAAVLYDGLTIRQLIDRDPKAYQDDAATIDRYRLKYISERAPVPSTRLNYYVCGDGGIGKDLFCRALARSLINSIHPELTADDDILFEVGAPGAAFEGYDGQPCVIWSDRRALDLLTELGGRGNVYRIFDTHPTRSRQNVKYSSVVLVNEINIVNSIQPWSEFFDDMNGCYKDAHGQWISGEMTQISQAQRRFPFVMPVHDTDFDLLLNRGVYEGTREYSQYIENKNIIGNMQKIAEACGTNEKLRREIEAKTVAPVVQVHRLLLDKIASNQKTEGEIRSMFANNGSIGVLPDEAVETPDDIPNEELPFK